MTDNLETPVADNSQAPVVDAAANSGIVDAAPTTTETETINAIPSDVTTGSNAEEVNLDAPKTASWKDNLPTDLKNSPLLQKFEDTPEGLGKAMESHANLEQLLGHEKVPIPKDANDTEGWNRFSKAMGIPDRAEAYGLPDSNLPESMQGVTIDKAKFGEIVHAHKLTPDQAKGLWEAYNEINIDTYQKAVAAKEQQVQDTVNRLKGDWGDAYETNVELGQTVINKFAPDQEDNDYITNVLASDPRGIKFLAKIGDQFAESKVGEFSMKKFSLGPEQAQAEIDKIKADPKHPYTNRDASDADHNAAVDYVNSLYATINRGRG